MTKTKPKHTLETWAVVSDFGGQLHVTWAWNSKEPHTQYGICQLHGDPGEERNANARLIAAAPELLKITKALLPWVQTSPGFDGLTNAPLLREAKTVIARAEGK